MRIGDKKIKLLYFHPTVVFGGAERTTSEIIKGLEGTDFEIVLVTKKNIFNEIKADKIIYIDDIPIRDGFKDFWTLIKDARKLAGVIKTEAPDVSFAMLHYGAVVMAVAKLFFNGKIKIITSPRTPTADAINFYCRNNLKEKLFWHLMTGFFCRYSDWIVTASEGLKKECVSRYKAKKDKVLVVNNCVSLNGNCLQRFRDNNDIPIISTAGRLASEKNIPVLLKAFAMLIEDIKAILWIIGDGPEKPILEDLTESLGIGGKVIFHGFCPEPYELIRKSDIFIHTSLFEGFGNSILETMACGVPVIATDCNYGPREIITHMKDGMLVPPSDENAMADAMRVLLSDRRLREGMALNALSRANDFSCSKMAEGYKKVFMKAAGFTNE